MLKNDIIMASVMKEMTEADPNATIYSNLRLCQR